MKQQEVFKRIGIIIKELNQQYDYLSSEENKLNDLELELFVANAHFLADHAEVLSKLNLQVTAAPPAEKPKSSHEEIHFEPLVQQVKPAAEVKTVVEEDKPTIPLKPVEVEITNADAEDGSSHGIDLRGDSDNADESFSFIRQEPEIIKHELILDESEDWDEDDEGFISEDLTDEPEEEKVTEIPLAQPNAEDPVKAPVPEPVEPVVTPETENVPETIAEVAVPVEIAQPTPIAPPQQPEEPLTINQKISAQLNPVTRVTEHMNTQVITDLKQAINLNDKLLYVRDLFNGYSLAYSEVIDILNRFTTFEEADKFLKTNYATKNSWDSKQATVDKFYVLLKRRYL